jgi:uncharacterized protein YgfB (UPF0149 family)
MSISSSIPEYDEVQLVLNEANCPYTPAEVHGYICGNLCITKGKTASNWDKVFFKNLSISPHTAAKLNELAEVSFHLISEFSFEFSLLLPKDDLDINIRTESLGLWCQGFLTGLKDPTALLKSGSTEANEALNDIIEIAQVSYGDINNSEEDETAYFELVEYVRLAIVMLFQELPKIPARKKTKRRSHAKDG